MISPDLITVVPRITSSSMLTLITPSLVAQFLGKPQQIGRIERGDCFDRRLMLSRCSR